MKAVILGDTHFGGGYSLGKTDQFCQTNTRLIDFSNTFDFVVDYMIENSIFHFIITGDIFEHKRPQSAEASLFSEKMFRLSDLGIHTHIIIGNHDLDYALKATTVDVLKNLKLPYVHIYSDIQSIECTDGTDDVMNFIFFPFRTRKMLKCSTNDEAIQRLSDRLQYEIRGISNQGPKILVGHLMLQGTKLAGGIADNHVGELVLPTKMFKSLDGTIMGHVHPHNILNKNPLIAYVGSMERKKFDEGKDDKYFLVIETKENELVYNFEQLPVRGIFDIVIDQSEAENSQEAVKGIHEGLIDFAKNNDLFGSILRIQVFINEKALHGISNNKIVRFMKKNFNIHHCVGIHWQISSKRQLRKETITERSVPLQSFNEYLDLSEDTPLREKMRAIGTKIINDRSK
jgi:exonuclease SbcD